MSVLTAHSFPFSIYKNYMLNTIILYQNVLCVPGIDYLSCMRKKSEIIEDYSVILSYTKVICDYRKYHFKVIQLRCPFYIRLCTRIGSLFKI